MNKKVDNILFLRPGDSETSKYVLQLICDKMREAKQVSICVAYFTHVDIAEAIIERTKSERPTQIILNLGDILRPDGSDSSIIKTSQALVNIFKALGRQSDSRSTYLQMRTLGREKSATSQMHHKFAIFDNVVAFGSLNFTFQALGQNYENIHFSSEDFLVAAFELEFSELWKLGSDFFVQGGKFRSITCPNCKKPEGVDFESYGAFCTYCSHTFTGTGF